MKKLFGLFLMLPFLALAGEVTVTSVAAQQRNLSSQLVDITVTIQGSAEDVAGVECSFAAMNDATKTSIPVQRIARNGDDAGSGDVWTRKFIWDAKADVGAVRIDDIALTVEAKPLGGVQLWENGPYWAECNVGANIPEEYGYYFWWGDTVGYKRNANNDGWMSVKDSSSFAFDPENCPTYLKDNAQLQSEEYIDSAGNLVAAHDAATVHLGAPWRMPTDAEFSALIDNCTTKWTERNDVRGVLVTGEGAYSSKSIFFPAAGIGGSDLSGLGSRGIYWSSAIYSLYSQRAYDLGFYSSSYLSRENCDRYYGVSVRPVRGFANTSVANVRVTTYLSLDFLSVVNVIAQPRYPWNGLVDLAVTIHGIVEDVADAECFFAAINNATKAKIPVVHITRDGEDTGSGTAWTRKFIWDARADVGSVKIDDVALTVGVKVLGGVQLWENGPYWAECNVGAAKPEECGYYFWWGDTVGYKLKANGWTPVMETSHPLSYYDRGPTYGKDNSQLQSEGYIDAAGNLVAAYDAAAAYLGAPWRMPTDAEFVALWRNCTATWTTRNGVDGLLVTGKDGYAAKSIFLPAAGNGDFDYYFNFFGSRGNYWSSTPHSPSWDYSYIFAESLSFTSDNFYSDSDSRASLLSVRPVREFANPSSVVGGVTTHLALDCREVTISFDPQGGSPTPSAKIFNGGSEYGELPAVMRTGYTFEGWYTAATDGMKVVPTTKIAGDQILYAHWSAHTYHVSYYANGGSGTMPTTSCEYDKEFEISANDFVRDGYAFRGWALEDVGEVVYLPGAKVKNLSDVEGGEVRFYAVWEESDLENPVITPADGAIFMTDSCQVSISCATEGATIYYSAKGTTPRQTDAYKYTAPFVINDTATIKAIAVKGDRKSEYVTATITKKTLTLADAVNAPSLTFTTGGVSPWVPVVDSSAAVGTETARSGAMGLSETADGNMSWMEVSVVGAGTLSFSWKVDCEWDESGACTWDRLMYFVDGADKDEDRIDGFTDWDSKSVTFTSGGTHTVRWVYFKDDYDEEDATYEDCGWVDGVVWLPLTVLEPIPELPPSASADEVRAALEGSADAKLQENITDATVYGQYREWAMKIGAETVKGAANSWISFAVDSAALLEKVPVDSDLKIEEFEPASAEGVFDFTVSVKDVTIGSGATDANLKKVFGLGGTTQLGTEEFDPDKVALEFGTPVNGKLKFTASPKDKTAKSFFMKMKVR